MSLLVLSTKFYLVVETYHSSPYDWVAFNDVCVCTNSHFVENHGSDILRIMMHF